MNKRNLLIGFALGCAVWLLIAAVPSQSDFDGTYFKTNTLPISLLGTLTNWQKLTTNLMASVNGSTNLTDSGTNVLAQGTVKADGFVVTNNVVVTNAYSSTVFASRLSPVGGTGIYPWIDCINDGVMRIVSQNQSLWQTYWDNPGASSTLHAYGTNRFTIETDTGAGLNLLARSGRFELEGAEGTGPMQVFGYWSGTSNGRSIEFTTDPTDPVTPLIAKGGGEVNTFQVLHPTGTNLFNVNSNGVASAYTAFDAATFQATGNLSVKPTASLYLYANSTLGWTVGYNQATDLIPRQANTDFGGSDFRIGTGWFTTIDNSGTIKANSLVSTTSVTAATLTLNGADLATQLTNKVDLTNTTAQTMAGSLSAASLYSTGNGATRFSIDDWGNTGVGGYLMVTNYIRILNDNGSMGFGAASDTIIARDAANTLALRNGVNAQAFNIYNTYTDSGNYEKLSIAGNGNLFVIDTQEAGTGVSFPQELIIGTQKAAALSLKTQNNRRWQVDSSGNFIAFSDNSFDIGASGANRPRTVYASDSFHAGATATYGSSITLPNNAYIWWGLNRPQIYTLADGVVDVTYANGTRLGYVKSEGLQGGGTKVLTSTTAADFLYISVPSTNMIGGKVFWTVSATDGTESQQQTGETFFGAVGKGTAVTAGLTTTTNAAVVSGGSLTAVLAANTTTNNVFALGVTATTSLTTTNLIIKWRLETPSTFTVNAL